MIQGRILWAALVLLLIPGPPTNRVMPPSETPLPAHSAEIQTIIALRRVTAQYNKLEVAIADGYEPLFGCIDSANGAMGWHYIHRDRASDDQLVLEAPELLLYERHNGRAKLVGVEYMIPAAEWDGDAPPEFVGETLHYKTTVGDHGPEDGVAPYYELHAWVWRRNPDGVFADWNPRVECPVD